MQVTDAELIEEFVNTLHRHSGRDDEESLAGPDGTGAWLRGHGLLDESHLSEADVRRLVDVRESLRTLLLANNGVDVDARAAWNVLDRAARRGHIELRFPDGEPRLVVASDGVDGAIGRILARVETAIASGAWPRLKACRARDCEWAFYDQAKNQSRSWCSMRACGNREKARTFRRRRDAPR